MVKAATLAGAIIASADMTFAESLLCNMRHVQHHAAQLNLILRQQTGSAPRWAAKAKSVTGAR